MDERPPFDPQRAAFWLVAFVIGIEALIALLGAGMCLMYSETIITHTEIKCDPDNRLLQLLGAALAAALAFAGVRK